MSEFRIFEEGGSAMKPWRRSISVERRGPARWFGLPRRWTFITGCSYDLGDVEGRGRAVRYCDKALATLKAENARGLGPRGLVLKP